MKTLSIDLETYSELDISKVGVYKYAENCEILLCAYAFDDEPVRIVDVASGEKFPFFLVDALYDKRILKTAYNAAFEINVLNKYFEREMDTLQWQCTMIQGLSLGLPSGLDKLGKVLNIAADKQKMAAGKKLVQYFSMPSKAKKSKKTLDAVILDNVHKNRNLPENNAEKWAEFKAYCKQDVESERAIRKRLEKFTMPGVEKRLWSLDQKINGNGVWIDMELVRGAIAIDAEIREKAYKKGEELTGGLNLNSNAQMLKWIEEQEGGKPKSLGKSARADLKAEGTTEQVREFLELKDIVSKTSVRKYEAMQETACSDNRARGMFQFYGANRTGRWSGRHIQLQNLPQNHIEDLETARQFVRQGNATAVKLFYENPSEVLSQLIRTAFVAEQGSRLIVADFSAIEARVISWLAEEQWRMDVFANGGDIYCASASEMFKVPVEKHGVNKELRIKGKIAELACGYGGGVSALKAFGADRMGLSDAEMEAIIKKWRKSNPKICQFWRIMECCAKKVIKTGTKKYCHKGIAFEYQDNFLFVTLPSGRKISYYKPEIAVDKSNHEYLTYEGSLQSGNGWGRNSTWGGKLVENIVQAVARDCLAVAMLKLDSAGYKIIMHVHDEVIMEMPEGVGSLGEVLEMMSQPIYWAEGLKLTAEGYETAYYKKE